jgi:hypothetical protein
LGLLLIGGDHVADGDAGAEHDRTKYKGKEHNEDYPARTHRWQRMPREQSSPAVSLGW